jgi:hypothetical protein
MSSPPRSRPAPYDANDKMSSQPIRASRSIPAASHHFDATPQHALARIAPRASSPYPAPSQERQACMGSVRNYRWIGWALTRRGSGGSMYTRKAQATREAPARGRAHDQPTTREGWVGRGGVAEGLVLPRKSGNADGGKEPWFKANAGSNKEPRLGQPYTTRAVSGVAKCMPCGSEGRTRTLLFDPSLTLPGHIFARGLRNFLISLSGSARTPLNP